MPGVACNVNIYWDPTLGANFHNLVVPPGTPPTPVPSIEMICMQMWTLGYITGQNKFTTTVLHRGGFIVLAGHDIGMMIPDITIPPTNLYYAIMWPFSSRKITFVSSSVQMNGQPVGCALAIPPFPMMTCGDPITAPLAFPLLNWSNNLTVGLTPGDIWMGVLNIGVSVAIDAAFAFIKPGPPTPVNWGMEVLGKLVPTSPRALAKKITSVVAGTVISIIDGKPKMEIKFGMSGVAEAGITVTPGNLTAEATAIGGQDNRLGVGPWAKTGVKRNEKTGDNEGFADAGVGKPPPKEEPDS